MITPVTLVVHPDEPAWGLFEGPMDYTMPDGHVERRWVQRIRVVRGDELHFYETDFGPASDYEEIAPLAMPSFGDDTVAELQAWGEKHRNDDYWVKRRAEMLAESTLVKDHLRIAEQTHLAKSNRSTIGPAVNVQRNEFPTQSIQSELKEKRNARRGRANY